MTVGSRERRPVGAIVLRDLAQTSPVLADGEHLSRRPGKTGRRPISLQIRRLIPTLAEANPLWRAPRIHGELLKLGIAVSERTVSRVLQIVKRSPSQTWRTFSKNHIGEVVSVEFFTVPRIRLRVLFVFLVVEHERRRVLRFGVTEHPTAEWAAQQMAEAFSETDARRYLIRDRDAIYGNAFRCRIHSLAMHRLIPTVSLNSYVRAKRCSTQPLWMSS